jgi:hypothetical protein
MPPGKSDMPLRPLSDEEMFEIDNLAAECEQNPAHFRTFAAELIRLREFAAIARNHRARLPRKLAEAFVLCVPEKTQTLELAQAQPELELEP